MKAADVVVADGPSLYQSLRGQHSNVHCIANAGYAGHFAPAALSGSTIEAISARALHAPMPNPRLGDFGVIDERIDLGLVAAIAHQRPDWQIVTAGPTVRIIECSQESARVPLAVAPANLPGAILQQLAAIPNFAMQ